MRIRRVECDIMGCTALAESVDTKEQFLSELRAGGWSLSRENDFCPDCAKEQDKAKKEKEATTP